MKSSRTALIVGAGIGGLAAGVALQRAGWTVRIFERADTPRELGFGLGLAPYAIRALRDLGVAEAVLPNASTAAVAETPRLEFRHVDGRVIRTITIDRHELPQGDLPAVVMRPVLHTALLSAVGPEVVSAGKEATGFEVVDGRAVLHLAGGAAATADMLIGADGVASAIRKQLHPDEPPPRPSGYFAVRGVSPAVHLLNGTQFIGYFGRGIEIGVVQASARMVYWYVSSLADDMRNGSLEPAAVLRRLTNGFDPQFQAIAGAATDIRVDELFVRDPLSAWGRGPVTLLGDAAHPMLPHTGQGAAQALVDAVALGRELEPPGDGVGALRRYERVRAGASRRIAGMGPRIARMTTTRNAAIAWVRNSAIRLVPKSALLSVLLQTKLDQPAAGGVDDR